LALGHYQLIFKVKDQISDLRMGQLKNQSQNQAYIQIPPKSR